MRTINKNLIGKYTAYKGQGHLVLAVTLSTYVKSESIGRSAAMQHMWDEHFMRRVMRRLPPSKAKIDHDHVVEISPSGDFHCHGFLSVPSELSDCLWRDGALHKRLVRDLRSFRKAGPYRPFRINSFLIEPPENVAAWAQYITKQQVGPDKLYCVAA